jgi:hypothetical protein
MFVFQKVMLGILNLCSVLMNFTEIMLMSKKKFPIFFSFVHASDGM